MISQIQDDLTNTIETLQSKILEHRHLKHLVVNMSVLYKNPCIAEKAKIADLAAEISKLRSRKYKNIALLKRLKEHPINEV